MDQSNCHYVLEEDKNDMKFIDTKNAIVQKNIYTLSNFERNLESVNEILPDDIKELLGLKPMV